MFKITIPSLVAAAMLLAGCGQIMPGAQGLGGEKLAASASEAEILRLLRRSAKLSFDLDDLNHDGVQLLAERMSPDVIEAMCLNLKAEARLLMRVADHDRDRYLSIEELRKIRFALSPYFYADEAHAPSLDVAYQSADTQEDGALSLADVETLAGNAIEKGYWMFWDASDLDRVMHRPGPSSTSRSESIGRASSATLRRQVAVHLQAGFKAEDLNHNGGVSFAEFIQPWDLVGWAQSMSQTAEMRLNGHDLDGDHGLDVEELAYIRCTKWYHPAGMPEVGQEAAEFKLASIKHVDRNHDGHLDQAELLHWEAYSESEGYSLD